MSAIQIIGDDGDFEVYLSTDESNGLLLIGSGPTIALAVADAKADLETALDELKAMP